jgi:hypothetical protein
MFTVEVLIVKLAFRLSLFAIRQNDQQDYECVLVSSLKGLEFRIHRLPSIPRQKKALHAGLSYAVPAALFPFISISSPISANHACFGEGRKANGERRSSKNRPRSLNARAG